MKIIQVFIWLYILVAFRIKRKTENKFGGIFCNFKNNKGAIVVEYVLLLLSCVAIASAVNKVFEIDNNVDDSGWVIKTWWNAVKIIAEHM